MRDSILPRVVLLVAVTQPHGLPSLVIAKLVKSCTSSHVHANTLGSVQRQGTTTSRLTGQAV